MFDYQAGEKYKLTLIITALAGLIAGVFFTLLLSTTSEPAHKPQRGGRGAGVPGRPANYEGRSSAPLRSVGGGMQPSSEVPQAPAADFVDKGQAQSLVQSVLPLIWDFSSTTANQSQERAMTYMTSECAQNYRQNVWTAEVSQQVTGAGMTSSFSPRACDFVTNTDDGSVVIKVEGEQVLNLQGQPPRTKPVTMEYLVKKTPGGLKISGISESGEFGS